MNVPTLTVFSLRGGIGKTSLVYHIAWMMSELGTSVLVCDLDPLANLTSTFLNSHQLTTLWQDEPDPTTIYKCVEALTKVGDLKSPELQRIRPTLHLLPGDLALAGFEDFLSTQWSKSLGSDNLFHPFRALTSFWHVAQLGAASAGADLILFDVGPGLGALNRSALIATDYVIVPLTVDLLSLRSLSYLGSTLHLWRMEWHKRRENWPEAQFRLPKGEMVPLGYILQQLNARLSRHSEDYDRFLERVSAEYRENVLRTPPIERISLEEDINCLAWLKHYSSLFSLSREARKPIFHLTAADGAIGAHAAAVREARDDFRTLATKILENVRLPADSFYIA